MPVNTEDFKTIMSKFATGVTVVTTCVDGEYHGLTLNAFCSVSLSPRLILVCVEKTAKTHDMIACAKSFAVNFLTDRQSIIAERFADPELCSKERFQNVRVFESTAGSPLLAETMGYLDCQKHNTYDAGDHTIFLGEVVEIFISSNNSPLLYFDREYKSLKNGRFYID